MPFSVAVLHPIHVGHFSKTAYIRLIHLTDEGMPIKVKNDWNVICVNMHGPTEWLWTMSCMTVIIFTSVLHLLICLVAHTVSEQHYTQASCFVVRLCSSFSEPMMSCGIFHLYNKFLVCTT